MDYDRFFFEARRRVFSGSLRQEQVDGLNSILHLYDDHFRDAIALRSNAYALATAYHETATTMQPITERGGFDYFHRMYDIDGRRPKVARTLGNLRPGDGALFCGRGLVQLTGRRNYVRATIELRALGLIAADVDLTETPDLVKDPIIAGMIMYVGMDGGWFTGRRFRNYFANDNTSEATALKQFTAARAIINGEDRAASIARIALNFERALKEAA